MQIPIILIQVKCFGLLHSKHPTTDTPTHQFCTELLSRILVGAGKGGLWICLIEALQDPSALKHYQAPRTLLLCIPVLHQLLRTNAISAHPTLSHRNFRTKKENSSGTHCTVHHPTDVLQSCPRTPQKADSKSTAGIQLCILQTPHSAVQAQSSHRNFSLLPT